MMFISADLNARAAHRRFTRFRLVTRAITWSILALLFVTSVVTAQPEPPPEKKYKLEFRRKPWRQVLEWLADESDLAYDGGSPALGGTLSFVDPADREYTLGQVIDILNEGLARYRYMILRRRESFTLIPSDEPIDPAIITPLAIHELPSRGRTELVRTFVPLKTLRADQAAKRVEQILGENGGVRPLPEMNALMLHGNVCYVQRAVHVLQSLDKPASARSR
jgi:hypothetical protein